MCFLFFYTCDSLRKRYYWISELKSSGLVAQIAQAHFHQFRWLDVEENRLNFGEIQFWYLKIANHIIRRWGRGSCEIKFFLTRFWNILKCRCLEVVKIQMWSVSFRQFSVDYNGCATLFPFHADFSTNNITLVIETSGVPRNSKVLLLDDNKVPALMRRCFVRCCCWMWLPVKEAWAQSERLEAQLPRAEMQGVGRETEE